MSVKSKIVTSIKLTNRKKYFLHDNKLQKDLMKERQSIWDWMGKE